MSDKKYLKQILLLSAFLIVVRSAYTEEKLDNQIILKEISTDTDAQINLDKSYEEEDLITPGKISLKNNGGYIYSIVDPIPREPKLSIKANKKQNIDSERVEFFIYTNYQEVIKKWEILVYDGEDAHMLDPVAKLEGTEVVLNKPIILTYSKEKIEDGDKYFYTLKVYDKEGRFDQTAIYPIEFVPPINATKNVDIANSIYGDDGAVIRNIQLRGSKVRVYGKDLQGVQKLSVNNQQVNLDYKGDFAYEYYTDMIGDLNLPVLMTDTEGNEYNYGMDVYLPSNYTFAVGIADLFVGKNYVSGSNAILQDNYEYDESIFSSGRLAFYYKRVWEDYRLTAQADTWEQETKYLFKGFSKRRPRDLFEKLERDDIEFNLGDGSTYYRDTDTAGKFYVKLEKQKSSILWGSFDTGFTGNYYADYNRSLYGFQGIYSSDEATSFGETKSQANVFVSEPETMFTRDEFRGTGGSVYFLSFQDIVVGSAKVKVQVTDGRTGRILREVVLQDGRDYDVNELQGRVILKNPLPTIIASTDGGIIKDQPYYGDNVNLVVDYEFYSNETDFGKTTYGVRGKSWVTDNVAIGGTLVSEARGDKIEDYELQGVDVTLRKTDNTFMRFEYAHSKGTQALINNFSFNGGYDSFLDRDKYEEIIGNPMKYFNNISGDAYSISGEIAFRDFSEKFDMRDSGTFWYNRKDKGFSTAGFSNSSEHDDYGFTSEFQLADKWDIGFGANKFKENDSDLYTGNPISLEEDRINGTLGYQYTEKLKLSVELEYLKNRESGIERFDNADEEALLAGVRADYEFQPNRTIYGIVQTSVWDDNYGANNIYTLGTDLRVTDKFRLNAEGSTGNKGNGVEVLGTYDFTPDHSLYMGYALDDNNDFGSNYGQEHTFTVGQKFIYDQKTSMYHENQFLKDNVGKGILQSYGVDYAYSEEITVGTLVQQGNLDTYSGNLERTSVSVYSRYYVRDFMIRNKLEFGKDKGAGMSADRWATINRGKWILDDEYTLFGELNYLYRDAKEEKDDRSVEAGLGLGYRPVWNDKLNLIGKYEYVQNIGINNQFNATNDTKAHILSLEGIYELTQRLDIGGKYAFRTEEYRAGRGEGDWYNSKLDLYAVRLNYEVLKSWYAFGEYHILRDITDDSYEHGALLGVYKEVQENLKVGVGYNFTEFDDDLSDLDYSAKGWFINVIGKF
ncbi:MAG: hypothetical protein ACRC8M_07450 [Cetobacterium sp.]|uniref:hypothetical protein n=1 Tax=Cetobacterium sp. TaxID=2071632 RepID=UPI003F32590F